MQSKLTVSNALSTKRPISEPGIKFKYAFLCLTLIHTTDSTNKSPKVDHDAAICNVDNSTASSFSGYILLHLLHIIY
jgi:hypothetical protein